MNARGRMVQQFTNWFILYPVCVVFEFVSGMETATISREFFFYCDRLLAGLHAGCALHGQPLFIPDLPQIARKPNVEQGLLYRPFVHDRGICLLRACLRYRFAPPSMY